MKVKNFTRPIGRGTFFDSHRTKPIITNSGFTFLSLSSYFTCSLGLPVSFVFLLISVSLALRLTP